MGLSRIHSEEVNLGMIKPLVVTKDTAIMGYRQTLVPR